MGKWRNGRQCGSFSLMKFDIHPLEPTHVPTLWQINEEGVPGVGKVSPEALSRLLNLCVLRLGAFHEDTLVGFVLCLEPQRPYGSLNYAWFNTHYTEFLYVDRIAVGQKWRDAKVGSLLYECVFAFADERGWPVAAEVNVLPPNPGSMRFHRRYGFERVGTLDHEKYSVGMFMRPSLPLAR